MNKSIKKITILFILLSIAFTFSQDKIDEICYGLRRTLDNGGNGRDEQLVRRNIHPICSRDSSLSI